MAWMILAWVALAVPGPQAPGGAEAPTTVRVALEGSSDVDVAEVVARLASALGIAVDRPPASLRLPLAGLAAPLTRSLLTDTLGPDVSLDVGPRDLVVTIRAGGLGPDRRDDWTRRLGDLSARATREVERRSRYGMHARPSYRPNDPSRPTVCLIHGLNSTSNVFVHFFPPLEAAGYGVVVYDFPYNRDLDETSAAFARDWLAFRRERGDQRPWGVVAHSMGSLLARFYVEDDASYARDVSTLILLAPPNHGSALAQGQTLLQMTQGLQSVQGKRRSDPLALLGDGLGAAAEDMTPGSAYLDRLNRRPRRAGVRYHLVAGDVGYLSASARKQIDARASGGGLMGGLGRLALAGTSGALDAITDGLGDGCVAVASTRLDGVADLRVKHANHLELIRAPLLYPEPGPVLTMPDILAWLAEAGGR